jgi:alpha-tubulin suppressor-like RCC1 family protein
VSVSAGDDHNLALKSDGSIWAWGGNYRGQLGSVGPQSVNTNRTAVLKMENRPVPGVSGNDWAQVQAGFATSYAVKRDGGLWAWGLNNFGQLGIGSWVDSATPIRVGAATNWVSIRAGGVSAAGIQSDGSLWIWGGSPKLGNTAPRSPENLLVPTRLTSETNWVDVAVAFNLWLAVKSDGTLWAWGRNAHIFTGNPPEAGEAPAQIGHGTSWQAVWSSGGGYHHLLRQKDGSFWVLDATSGNRSSAQLKQVHLPTDVVSVDTGGRAVAAITSDRCIWTCGAVLGRVSAKQRLIRYLEMACWRVGWKVSWTSQQPALVVQEQPWRLRIIERED